MEKNNFGKHIIALLHSERPKLYVVLVFLSAVGLNAVCICTDIEAAKNDLISLYFYLKSLKFSASRSFLKYCWLVGCFWFNCPFRQYFSLIRAVSQKQGERKR